MQVILTEDEYTALKTSAQDFEKRVQVETTRRMEQYREIHAKQMEQEFRRLSPSDPGRHSVVMTYREATKRANTEYDGLHAFKTIS